MHTWHLIKLMVHIRDFLRHTIGSGRIEFQTEAKSNASSVTHRKDPPRQRHRKYIKKNTKKPRK